MIRIKKVEAICTAPEGINLIVVKVTTDEPGLTGLGCATFAYRHKAVSLVVDEYLSPLLMGRNVDDIEDLWRLMNYNSYWRNGPVVNNAIAGVDAALWDIKGKLAGMPLYKLLGGKSRQGAAVYRHADGKSLDEIADNVERFLSEGINHVRVQWGGYGGVSGAPARLDGVPDGFYINPDAYARNTVELFDFIRGRFGFGVELIHDCHERIAPIEAVRLAKALEPYRLFFLEDVLSPEQGAWMKTLRSQCATPIAIGELYNNPKEWEELIAGRLIDFIRVHISQIGGITPAKKLAAFADCFGVRTAWHGPGDVSPVGHAINVHFDIVSPNFGIQEWPGLSGLMYEIFPGAPTLRGGYVYPSESPGLGVSINEELAAKYPPDGGVTKWTMTRLPDGTLTPP